MSSQNKKLTKTNTKKTPAKEVFSPTENGIYRSERKLRRIGMGIRRGDTRHGDYSNVVVWKWSDSEGPSRRFTMTLAEARSLKSFLDSELAVLAR